MCDVCDTDGEYSTCSCYDCDGCGERICPTCHHVSRVDEIWPSDDEDEDEEECQKIGIPMLDFLKKMRERF